MIPGVDISSSRDIGATSLIRCSIKGHSVSDHYCSHFSAMQVKGEKHFNNVVLQ